MKNNVFNEEIPLSEDYKEKLENKKYLDGVSALVKSFWTNYKGNSAFIEPIYSSDKFKLDAKNSVYDTFTGWIYLISKKQKKTWRQRFFLGHRKALHGVIAYTNRLWGYYDYDSSLTHIFKLHVFGEPDNNIMQLMYALEFFFDENDKIKFEFDQTREEPDNYSWWQFLWTGKKWLK